SRLWAIDRATPDGARLARDRIGEAPDDAGRCSLPPWAAGMKAQATVVRYILKRDATAMEVSFAIRARDSDGLAPDAVRRFEPVGRWWRCRREIIVEREVAFGVDLW